MQTPLPDFHLLAKPAGAACNLGCQYCFFLSKENLYPRESPLMHEAMLDTYIRQLMESAPGPQVDIAWQGGEPMLRGLDFYRRSVQLANQYRKPNQRVLHTMQTNGTLVDDEWAVFFKENNCLVGLSVDGPRALHDAYRVDKQNKGSFDDVIRGWHCLRKHDVDVNILCTIHAANAEHPLEVYRFFATSCRHSTSSSFRLSSAPLRTRSPSPTGAGVVKKVRTGHCISRRAIW